MKSLCVEGSCDHFQEMEGHVPTCNDRPLFSTAVAWDALMDTWPCKSPPGDESRCQGNECAKVLHRFTDQHVTTFLDAMWALEVFDTFCLRRSTMRAHCGTLHLSTRSHSEHKISFQASTKLINLSFLGWRLEQWQCWSFECPCTSPMAWKMFRICLIFSNSQCERLVCDEGGGGEFQLDVQKHCWSLGETQNVKKKHHWKVTR